MGSSFSCYEIGRQGMFVSQRGLDVTGHNISNVDTVGYVRQTTVLAEKSPLSYAGYKIGTGVDIDEVRQMRSIFLDNMYRKENSSLSYWNTMSKSVEEIESVMDNLSEDGIGNAINAFFGGWEELAKDPESRSCREALVEYGTSLVDMVNQLSEQLGQMQKDLDAQIRDMANRINSIAGQVADLNGLILKNELGGNHANDYRDQLNALLDTLSGYANIKVTEDSRGMVSVTLGGATLVNGTNAMKLSCSTNSSNGAFTTVRWKDSGIEVKLKSGELLALINSRGDVNGDRGSAENGSPVESGTREEDVDSDSEAYSFSGTSENLLSELRTGLNLLVSLMTRKINAIHRSGVGLDGSTGVDFFVKIDESLPFEAGNIKINPALEDPNKIAASATGASGDVSIADKIVDFKSTEYFRNDSLKMNIDDFYSFLVNWVGTAGEEAAGFKTNQGTLVQQIQNKKEALSAVSLDEEMTNMIRYQHAYNASVQVVNIIDGMLDKIINGTGTVGR